MSVVSFLLLKSRATGYDLECQPVWYWNICMDMVCTEFVEKDSFTQSVVCNASKDGCLCDENLNPISSACPDKVGFVLLFLLLNILKF